MTSGDCQLYRTVTPPNSAGARSTTMALRFEANSMEVVMTAVGPDNMGLADPIIHHVTGLRCQYRRDSDVRP